MLFNSFEFVVFFALVLLVYWRLPHRAQNWLLLVASLIFYGSWNSKFLLLIVASASIDFLCGLGIAGATSQKKRRAYLVVGLVSSLAILGFFKYANFFLDNLVELLEVLGVPASRPALNIILPVGITFHTFQAMSYAIDVYRREQEVCRNYFDYLLYITFFPQLVAGPIERAARLLPQFVNPRPRLNLGATLESIKLIIVGYAQKVAIADVLAPTVDDTFANIHERGGWTLLFGLYAFAIQIYCDFAGYSNIARGTARLLGFQLMRNFAQPYLAVNITEFWRRWHISLSTWLRDYLYIPLGGNRRGRARTYVNLMITMLLGGLWHGASWTFVTWGGLHGSYLAAHKAWTEKRALRAAAPFDARSRLKKLACWLLTFHLVCLAWIFFRAESFADAWAYLGGMMRGGTQGFTREFVEVALYFALAFGLDFLLERRRSGRLSVLFSRHWVLETCALAGMVAMILFVGENHVVPFVYFQF